MQPFDLHLTFPPSHSYPPVSFAGADPPADTGAPAGAPLASAPLRLAAPALLVEARFRGITLASRLLRADDVRTFAIGNARGTDAPVNPAWLPEGADPVEPRRHLFLEPATGGFVLHLTQAMRAVLRTELHLLPLSPDVGRAEAPLALSPGSCLHVPCGEVTFDIYPAEPVAPLPRPWLPPRWRSGLKYPLLVALAIGLLMLLAHLVPADPRALSLDTIDRTNRVLAALIIPPELNAPATERARDLQKPGGGGAAAAPKPAGQAGDRKSHDVAHHLTIKGTGRPQDARAVAAQIHDSTLLAVLDGPRTSALADVLADGPALGADAQDIVGNLVASNAGPAFGAGGLGPSGTGRGGDGEHEGTIGGGGPLGTTGKIGGHGGPDYGLGPGVGGLRTRHAVVPNFIPGILHVDGSLDKEIIRRTVRRHLNEVKSCYEQALLTRPSLVGRIVVQFAIAPTGRVLSSVVQSSSLGVAAVDSCVVNAVKRWEFPQPDHGGLAVVSYPFSFSPAGG